jgi:Tol biopolymer transport system component
MPGDVNEDSLVDVGDVVYEINYLFRHGAYPLCLDCADPNGTCNIEVGDVVYLVNYLFKAVPETQIPECDWSEPVNLGLPINSPRGEESFRMTPDGRMAVFASSRVGTHGNEDIWYSFWDTVSGTWSEPQNCGLNINSVIRDLYPSLSPDGKKLYCLLYGRPGGYGDWDIWVSTWDSLNNQWGVIENLGPPINTFYSQGTPFLSPDGTKLYFSSNGLWVSEWNGTEWSYPVSLGHNINTTSTEEDATVTADNRIIYFNRCGSTYYICVSHWTGTEWGPAVVLDSTINGPWGARQPYITADGSKLYFTSSRPGGLGSTDVWVSSRIAVDKHNYPKEKK